MTGSDANAVERRLAELAEEIRHHRGCGFEPCETCLNPVPGEGPPGNRDPKPDEIFHSWPWLKEQIELIRPRVIAPLGRHALQCFLPGAKVSQDHGRAIEQAGWTYFPLYHPAAAFRVRPLRETMFADVAKLPGVVASAPEPPPELTIEPLAAKR